jgi:hypothetical protein
MWVNRVSEPSLLCEELRKTENLNQDLNLTNTLDRQTHFCTRVGFRLAAIFSASEMCSAIWRPGGESMLSRLGT